MSRIFLSLAALPLMGMTLPIGMVVSVGGSAARSCYQSAVVGDISSGAFRACDAAIGGEEADRHNVIATFVNRGILHMMRGDYGRAEQDYGRAVEMAPSQPDAWLNFAIAHYQQGKLASAASMFERALTLRTRDPALAYYGRALVKEDRGDVHGAYADLRRAAELKPHWNAPVQELKRYRVVRKDGG